MSEYNYQVWTTTLDPEYPWIDIPTTTYLQASEYKYLCQRAGITAFIALYRPPKGETYPLFRGMPL